MSYIDGFVLAVPTANRDAFHELVAKVAGIFTDNGASRVIECWGDDVPDGKLTDFRRAVQAKEDETIVFSWVEWPSKEARDAGNERIAADPRMQPDPNEPAPFDPQRMIFGGFRPLIDVRPGRNGEGNGAQEGRS